MNNAAALTAGAGVGALEKWIGATGLSVYTIKCAAVAAFGINFIAVQVPGRLDGEVAKSMKENPKESTQLLPAIGKSYIAPAGWAFAIWGPIYLGELIFSVVVPLLQFDGVAGETVKEILPFWISTHLFQSLWCATFRPKFHTDRAKQTLGPFVSALFLGLTARSLGMASWIISTKSSALTLLKKALFVPIKMHFGWTTAATLVNVNGALANYREAGTDRNLFALGCTSIAAALAASAGVAVKTRDATYSLVIGWALAAISGQMGARISNAGKGVVTTNAERIRLFSKLGSAGSLLLAALTFTPIFPDSTMKS